MKKLVWLLAAMMLLVSVASAESVTGTATGTGEVQVTLTMENGKITDAQVDVSNETPGFGLDHAEDFAQQLLAAQGAEIDGVSGVTITTNAVKAAAAQALSEAGLAKEAVAMTPGVYLGSAMGAKSTIRMAVEVSEDAILNVWPVSSNDTAVFSRDAVAAVAEEIVAAQSLAVDAYSGATLSSNGAINAVADALSQAGADVNALRIAAKKEKTQGEDVEVDVLVLGAGTSGLTAAISAKTDSSLGLTDSGLSVLVVERNSFGGGDMGYSGGYIATPSGNPPSS